MLCPFTLPDASAETIQTVVERALDHAASLGFATVELEVATHDEVLQRALTERGGARTEPAVVEAWLDIDQRQAVTELAEGYTLRSRAEMDGGHHLAHETGAVFEERLHQGSLYVSSAWPRSAPSVCRSGGSPTTRRRATCIAASAGWPVLRRTCGVAPLPGQASKFV